MLINVQGEIHLAREMMMTPVGYLIHARGDVVTGKIIAFGYSLVGLICGG